MECTFSPCTPIAHSDHKQDILHTKYWMNFQEILCYGPRKKLLIFGGDPTITLTSDEFRIPNKQVSLNIMQMYLTFYVNYSSL